MNDSTLTPQGDELDSGSCVEQIGALCYRITEAGGTEILLITTRETKRWTIPKGWPIEGRKPHQVAEQEAWEEAGVVGHAKRRSYGAYDYLKRLSDGEWVSAVVDVHVLAVKRTKRRFPERRERRLAWFSPDEAARLVEEPRLQKLVRRFGASKPLPEERLNSLVGIIHALQCRIEAFACVSSIRST